MLLDDGRAVAYATREWDEEYRARVLALVDIAHRHSAQLALIGMPPMRQASFSQRMAHLNAVTQQALESHGALFISAWDLAGDARGRYVKAVTVDGEHGLARLADGVHYSRLGAEHVASGVAPRLERALGWVPSDDTRSVYLRRQLASRALGRSVSYGVYVPQRIPWAEAGLPVVILLHGEGGSADEWPEHAHALLQRLSSELRLIVLTPEGGREGWYLDSARLPEHRYASHIVDEVLYDADRWLPTNGQRGIMGEASGGHGALALALTHDDLFRSVSTLSGMLDPAAAGDDAGLSAVLGPYEAEPRLWHGLSARSLVERDLGAARRLSILITVGSADPWAPVNRAFDRVLGEDRVPHRFSEHAGGHDWQTWLSVLHEHLEFHATLLHAHARKQNVH
jgi:S-formylglutathione hydrolase FrmB